MFKTCPTSIIGDSSGVQLMTQRVTFRIDDDLLGKLDYLAQTNQTNRSHELNNIINDRFNGNIGVILDSALLDKVKEAAKKLGTNEDGVVKEAIENFFDGDYQATLIGRKIKKWFFENGVKK